MQSEKKQRQEAAPWLQSEIADCVLPSYGMKADLLLGQSYRKYLPIRPRYSDITFSVPTQSECTGLVNAHVRVVDELWNWTNTEPYPLLISTGDDFRLLIVELNALRNFIKLRYLPTRIASLMLNTHMISPCEWNAIRDAGFKTDTFGVGQKFSLWGHDSLDDACPFKDTPHVHDEQYLSIDEICGGGPVTNLHCLVHHSIIGTLRMATQIPPNLAYVEYSDRRAVDESLITARVVDCRNVPYTDIDELLCAIKDAAEIWVSTESYRFAIQINANPSTHPLPIVVVYLQWPDLNLCTAHTTVQLYQEYASRRYTAPVRLVLDEFYSLDPLSARHNIPRRYAAVFMEDHVLCEERGGPFFYVKSCYLQEDYRNKVKQVLTECLPDEFELGLIPEIIEWMGHSVVACKHGLPNGEKSMNL